MPGIPLREQKLTQNLILRHLNPFPRLPDPPLGSRILPSPLSPFSNWTFWRLKAREKASKTLEWASARWTLFTATSFLTSSFAASSFLLPGEGGAVDGGVEDGEREGIPLTVGVGDGGVFMGVARGPGLVWASAGGVLAASIWGEGLMTAAGKASMYLGQGQRRASAGNSQRRKREDQEIVRTKWRKEIFAQEITSG